MPDQMPDQLPYEFHVSRAARDRYEFESTIFATNGNVVFANFHAVRVFAQKMNSKRDLINFPEQTVKAGELNAMGLIDEILHLVLADYRRKHNPEAFSQALEWLRRELGNNATERTLLQFCAEFPPGPVYRREMSIQEYLSSVSDGVPNRLIVLEEMLMLWISNANPAFDPFEELFNDTNLTNQTSYKRVIDEMYAYFKTQPGFGPKNQNIVDLLRAPALAFPGSLTDQLEFLRTNWSMLIGDYLYRLLSSMDLIREENKPVFFGPGPARVVDYEQIEHEPERFSIDREWMPNLVLLAKNSYVWLDQLSKRYQEQITHLDQIPEAELKKLADWGFTGLWLIGLWERSPASKRIKQMRGNPEAVASAYSLFAYDIAEDLGGDEAYQRLRDKAWKFGIRLASDMVPNHMGIDSRWLIEHPDWFIGLDYSPFPNYSYNGPNLSWDNRVGIYLEDHYYDSTDAAVVFKRVDFWTGSEKYIYHGNDGTSMPWNDTAQLNYLLAEVREAVIQTILHVARKFPVIRFDAAMTLAKKHYQRLWFPEPGSGGDIPTRAEYGLTREQFDQAIPEEFWREVVDRVAQEAPDTLLLAEAFWLMEGYFVRTLGMHRVYNSAFMNMMRDEKNQEYRLVIKNTIEFEPQILQRYVNFMNNPDERTAVDQFGKGDKYFGICIMMATLPGLPMFGHGQIEGYSEKYGMEYRRAYWDERDDQGLIDRHRREVFPVLRKRYLFANAYNFRLFDFYTSEGFVNEDVFAYTNKNGSERALVIYHNKYATAKGWIRISTPYPLKNTTTEDRLTVQQTLGEVLDLHSEADYFVIFKDQTSGLEYLRHSQELYEKGLYIELEAYKYHVFVDFREVQENEFNQYSQLDNYLNGRGVPDIEDALKEIILQAIHHPYRELMNPGQIDWLILHRSIGKKLADTPPDDLDTVLDEAAQKAKILLQQVQTFIGSDKEVDAIAERFRENISSLLMISAMATHFPYPEDPDYNLALDFIQAGPELSPPDETDAAAPIRDGDPYLWGTLFAWLLIRSLGNMGVELDAKQLSRTWLDEWLLGKITAEALHQMGISFERAQQAVVIIKILLTQRDCDGEKSSLKKQALSMLEGWLGDPVAQGYLGINRYQDKLWFNKESFSKLLWWIFSAQVINTISQEKFTASDLAQNSAAIIISRITECWKIVEILKQAEERSSYQVSKLLAALE